MMNAYAVLIKDDFGKRWIDSLWVIKDRAVQRMESVKASIAAMNAEHHVWMVPLVLEDAVLAEMPQQEKSDEAE